MSSDDYDVIVIGGGHAGLEASIAAARMGCRTALITMDRKALGRMSCNPAIGGTAKGHLVHEIDALGGVMARLADATGIQFRILNLSKGPAVWSSRCQSDRRLYEEACVAMAASVDGLEVIEGIVNSVDAKDRRITGVRTGDGRVFSCRAAVVTAGTFLNGRLYTGMAMTPGGRVGEPPALGLTESLEALGLESGKLKTGTPPRITSSSIDYSKCEEQPGDDPPLPFSLYTDRASFPEQQQVSCWLTHTNPAAHDELRKGFDRSPLFLGLIVGSGPRYCPSIEDKIVRFADRDRHHIFLEPEGLDDPLVYVNGFPTSLPEENQLAALHSIPGLEQAEMVRPGYAVEYDFFPSHQILPTMETRNVQGLYLAGQVNGTSGYEEAAALGLMAGINAACRVQGREPVILKRSDAYIGVLIDDLINKAPREPYRMFTSRAEYRLLLRQDNADRRLHPLGHRLGLVTDDALALLEERERLIGEWTSRFQKIRIAPAAVNPLLRESAQDTIPESVTVARLCKRPDLGLRDFIPLLEPAVLEEIAPLLADERALGQVQIELKYEGYLKRQEEEVARSRRMEEKKIPEDFDYDAVNALSFEGRENLKRVRPLTLGQASRLSGVRNADLSVLMVVLRGRG